MGSMFSIEEFIIAVFCCVDDLLKELTQGHRMRQKGFAPALADSEVLTMEIVAEFQGIDSDQAIWSYSRRHWQAFFPQMPCRSTFVRQAASLWHYKQLLQHKLAERYRAVGDNVHLIDGLPIPLCGFSRAPQCRSFRTATVRPKSKLTTAFMVICSSAPLA